MLRVSPSVFEKAFQISKHMNFVEDKLDLQ